MGYKVGDKVLIKATVEKVTDDYVRIYAEGYGERSFSLDNAPVEHKTYEQGLADAWELAKKIVMGVEDGGFDSQEVIDVFGKNRYYSFKDLTAEEALVKIEAYEKEKEIKVGDVVRTIGGIIAGVVTRVNSENPHVVWADGATGDYMKSHLVKTGKHIDIESLLKEIGE